MFELNSFNKHVTKTFKKHAFVLLYYLCIVMKMTCHYTMHTTCLLVSMYCSISSKTWTILPADGVSRRSSSFFLHSVRTTNTWSQNLSSWKSCFVLSTTDFAFPKSPAAKGYISAVARRTAIRMKCISWSSVWCSDSVRPINKRKH